jgi:hypothetical protein
MAHFVANRCHTDLARFHTLAVCQPESFGASATITVMPKGIEHALHEGYFYIVVPSVQVVVRPALL